MASNNWDVNIWQCPAGCSALEMPENLNLDAYLSYGVPAEKAEAVLGPVATTSVWVTQPPAKAAVGDIVTLKMKLTTALGPLGFAAVQLWVMEPGASVWYYTTNTSTDINGVCSVDHKFGKSGTYKFFWYYPDTLLYQGSRTEELSTAVTGEVPPVPPEGGNWWDQLVAWWKGVVAGYPWAPYAAVGGAVGIVLILAWPRGPRYPPIVVVSPTAQPSPK